jgi:hypothetical protein
MLEQGIQALRGGERPLRRKANQLARALGLDEVLAGRRA